MTNQFFRGIAGLPACPSHLRWGASVLECGSALPLFGRRPRRPQAPGPARGSRTSLGCSSATTCRFPRNPSRTLFNPCNLCNSFNSLVAAQARFLGHGMISTPFLPLPAQANPQNSISGSLWSPLVPLGALRRAFSAEALLDRRRGKTRIRCLKAVCGNVVRVYPCLTEFW